MVPKCDEVMAFRRTLTPESDRGCALIAAAFVDAQLKELFRACFIDDAKCMDDPLGTSKPLGTFSARIDLAFALGLLDSDVHRDLHLIRKIRNEFGHNPLPISFTEPAIASRCRELPGTLHDKAADPRRRFTNTIMSALADIHVATSRVTKPVVPDRVSLDAQRLRANFEVAWQSVESKLTSLNPLPSSYQEFAEEGPRLFLEVYKSLSAPEDA